MMELVFSDSAKKELENLPQDMKAIFLIHLEKIHSRTPGKHMKHGILCHVEKVTKQARIIYTIKKDRTYILHCFSSHKEYEHWYRSYK
jgi:phage-related protein